MARLGDMTSPQYIAGYQEGSDAAVRARVLAQRAAIEKLRKQWEVGLGTNYQLGFNAVLDGVLALPEMQP